MKRSITAIWALALALVCTACAPINEEITSANTQSGASSEEAAQTRTPGTLYPLDDTIYNFWGTNTGDAYYELANLNETSKYLFLKTDYASGEQTCLCQKPGCAHADESCNAFLRLDGFTKWTVIGDTFYVMYTSHPVDSRTEAEKAEEQKQLTDMRDALATEEEKLQFDANQQEWADKSGDEDRPSYVDAVSLDGVQKRRVAAFPRDWQVIFTCSDGKYLYGYSEGEEVRMDGSQLIGVWLDLQTGEYGTFPIGVGYVCGVFENKIICQRVKSDQDINALMTQGSMDALYAALQNASNEYFSVEPFTGKQEVLAVQPHLKARKLMILKNRLYYGLSENNPETMSVRYLDLTTGQETVLGEEIANSWVLPSPNANLMPLGTDAQQHYVRCMDSNDMSASATCDKLFDLETGEIKSTTLQVAPDEYGGTSPIVMAQANDGRWLIAAGRMSEKHNERARYALITQEDFFAGNSNYTEVEMYEISNP